MVNLFSQRSGVRLLLDQQRFMNEWLITSHRIRCATYDIDCSLDEVTTIKHGFSFKQRKAKQTSKQIMQKKGEATPFLMTNNSFRRLGSVLFHNHKQDICEVRLPLLPDNHRHHIPKRLFHLS